MDDRPQFDWRRGDNSWTNERREEFRELYTNAWVTLQGKYNPNWITEPEELDQEFFTQKNTLLK